MSEATAHKKEEERETAIASRHLPFIENCVSKLPTETFSEHCRLTPQGLFLSLELLPKILESYREWLTERVADTAAKSDAKLLKKLFGTDSPPKQYLLEGKKVLYGTMLECPLAEPQKYRVSFYLGTPLEAKDYLHSSDPVFRSMPEARIEETKGNRVLVIHLWNKDYKISMEQLHRFRQLSGESIEIRRKYPKFEDSLAETARAFVEEFEKSRRLRAYEEGIRPRSLASMRKGLECHSKAGFLFYFDEKGDLLNFYHAFGKNLYFFLRDEIAALSEREIKGKLITLHFLSRKERNIAYATIHARRIEITGHTLRLFVSDCLENPDWLRRTEIPRTVRTFLDAFLSALEPATLVERRLIEGRLGVRLGREYHFLLNHPWLFCISDENELTHCFRKAPDIAAHRSEHQHRHHGNFQRRGQRNQRT